MRHESTESLTSEGTEYFFPFLFFSFICFSHSLPLISSFYPSIIFFNFINQSFISGQPCLTLMPVVVLT